MAAKKKAKKKVKKITLTQLCTRAKKKPAFFDKLLKNHKKALKDAGLSLSAKDARTVTRLLKRKPILVDMSLRKALLAGRGIHIGPITWQIVPDPWPLEGPYPPLFR